MLEDESYVFVAVPGMMRFFGLLLCLLLVCPAFAGTWLSQKHDEAGLREGPGYNYRILWLYRHKGYPFALVASYDAWRRVRDVDGIVGWMHVSMLSDQRTVLVTGKTDTPLRDGSAANARIIGKAQPGAVARLRTCTKDVCEIAAGDIDAWIDRNRLFGVDAGEGFK
jgi:SH3-like domain-containing protein